MLGLTAVATRRRFLAHFSGIGLGSTLLPGVLWAQMQEAEADEVTLEMLRHALAVAGLEFSDDDQEMMVDGINQSLRRYEELRAISIPNNVSPPFHFSPLVPGMTVKRKREPFRMSVSQVQRPRNLEEVAFWPVVDLSHLVRTRQVTSVELTEMYLDRMRRYNRALNCVVTFLDDLAFEQAERADAEIADGRYRGPLHGIPWGVKDIISVKGHPTQWGSGAYRGQIIDEDSSLVEMLTEAGAVLLAKLATGELAAGDRWFGGQTLNPWNPEEGSSGSSAGSASATAAGLVAFSLGTETSGSILSPSTRCGVTGLRPTLGRVTRHGAMALSWTQDRVGPMCRYAEDCALVMSVISRPDGRDMSVVDLPFNWNADLDVRTLRVGTVSAAFDEVEDPVLRRANERTLREVEALGVRLVDVEIPEFTTDVSAIGVESGAFFDEFLRSGQYRELTRPERANGMKRSRLVPASEYLQQQRIRMMMMQELATATAHVDVYLAPRTTGSPPGNGQTQAQETVTRRHSAMANLATYPAVSVPNGFRDSGSPMSMTFFARPFGETELLAVAKAYQDATDFHRRHPDLTA